MVAGRRLTIVVVLLTATVFGYGVQRSLSNRIIAVFWIDQREVVVRRTVGFLEADHLDYVVKTSGVVEGPFYIGPVFHSSPNLQIALFGDNACCIYNRDRPDDVYCFLDFGNRLYYPSPDQAVTTDIINRQLATDYRASASLTNMIVSP